MTSEMGFVTISKIIIGDTTIFAWFLSSFLLLSHVTTITRAKTIEDKKVVDIGIIFDYDSQMWKEVHTAIEMACQDHNNLSMGSYELRPHYKDSRGSSIQAISAARKLKREKVKVIIGLNEWQDAVLVAEFCNQFQIPVISLARSPLPPAQMAPPWPLLMQMSVNMLERIQCIVDIVYAYNKRRVSIIYEEEVYGDSNSGILGHLSKGLRIIGSEVVDHVLLPTFSSSSNPETLLKQSLVKMKAQLPSLIIVLQLSLPMTSTLLKEAQKIGLFGEGCEWIFAKSPSSLIDSIDLDLNSSMKDVLGIMTYHPQNNLYLDFIRKFGHKFHVDHKQISSYHPGIHASYAYDIVSTISRAVEKTPSDHFTSKLLFRNIEQSNKFTGLSGEIYFEAGQLLHSSELEIVSFGDKNEFKKPISFWSPKMGFSKNPTSRTSWELAPESLESYAKGQKQLKPMVIGVPRKTFFDMFVKEKIDGKTKKTSYVGFCIDIFNEVLNLLDYKLDYEFSPHDGTYDELVQKVNNKTYGAAVGDVTILADRSRLVDFPQAYMESGLSMIVPAQPNPQKAWIFIKPFTSLMWAAFGGIVIYTMFTVWALEHGSNPEFKGSWTHQIFTAMWFTLSSLFFAHREQVHHNFTKIVLVIWFFVALILTQSYTASLTSMLTVQRLRSNINTMELLKSTNAKVGCANNTFLCDYLEKFHGFKRENFVNIDMSTDFRKEFQSGNISALFLEYPFEKAFFERYCNGYIVTHQSYRFGGVSFVFPKGSPLVDDFSEAILKLLENGKIKTLIDRWFSPKCISTNTSVSDENLRLSLDSFWGLFVSTCGVSTLSLLLALVCFRRSHQCHQVHHVDNLERELNVYNVAR